MALLAGMFGWVKGSGFLSKVVEKTKTVTENVITTLDPQMKEFIHSGRVRLLSGQSISRYLLCY